MSLGMSALLLSAGVSASSEAPQRRSHREVAFFVPGRGGRRVGRCWLRPVVVVCWCLPAAMGSVLALGASCGCLRSRAGVWCVVAGCHASGVVTQVGLSAVSAGPIVAGGGLLAAGFLRHCCATSCCGRWLLMPLRRCLWLDPGVCPLASSPAESGCGGEDLNGWGVCCVALVSGADPGVASPSKQGM